MWEVETTDAWFTRLSDEEKEEIDALVGVLNVVGPQLKRPHADTLNGSAYANMKELRGKTSRAVLRVAFAFDPLQHAILLVGGDKSGISEKMFYKQLIAKADTLYAVHLLNVEQKKREQENKAEATRKNKDKKKGKR